MKIVNNLKKCFITIPLALLVNVQCLRKLEKGDLEDSFSNMYIQSFTSVLKVAAANNRILVLSFLGLAFLFILAMIFGMDLYKEVYSTGIYVLTRTRKKKKWFLQLILKLGLKCTFSAMIYAGCVAILYWYQTDCFFDKNGIRAYYIAVLFVAYNIFFIALIINFVSIVKNSSYGVFSGAFALVVMLLYVLYYTWIPGIGAHVKAMYLVPISITNLYFETNLSTIMGVLFYLVGILMPFVGYMLYYFEKMDVNLTESDG